VRMIRHVFGETKFFKALRFYLNAHKFKTATYNDLIKAFEKASFVVFKLI
jgi:aminopeptidase N